MREKLLNHYFLSQPHQPFFVLAFVNALVSMILFASVYNGFVHSAVSIKLYHVYSLIFLLFTPAFLAFLLTTFPRFSNTEPITKKKYLSIFYPYLMASVLSYFSLSSPTLLALSMFFAFLAHLLGVHTLWSVYKHSALQDQYDQFWILIASAFGLIAELFFITALWIPALHVIGIQIGIYLYLFLVFFAISQRMVPFFSHSPIEKHKERFQVIVGLLALHIFLELIQPHSSFLADFFLAYLIGRELYRWKLPFPNANPLVWILHIALFWIPIAFLLSAISNIMTLTTGIESLYLGIHTLALGFFLTMLIGFGTRVTLGHSGNMMMADKYTKYLFYGTQTVVLARILTSLFGAGEQFILFFNLSIALWLMLFISWAYRFFAVLVFGKKL